MYKIVKNPINDLDKKLDLILEFIKNNTNRTASNYQVITKLGLNFVNSTFDLELSLEETINNSKVELVKFTFPILYSEEYTVEVAQVAHRLLEQYYKESEDIVLSRQRQNFEEFNCKLLTTNELSDDFQKYFSDEDIQQIIAD